MRGKADKKDAEPTRLASSKRITYHTKRYTDWAKEATKKKKTLVAVPPKEETKVLERYDYTKHDQDNSSVTVETGVRGQIPKLPNMAVLPEPNTGTNENDIIEEGKVMTEDEAKVQADRFIARIKSTKRWRCLWTEGKSACDYQTERLALVQAHVYGHLNIWTNKCKLCGKVCRLETNFEKHLNTHGLTRRANKCLQYKMYNEQSEENVSPSEKQNDKEEPQKAECFENTKGNAGDRSLQSLASALAQNNSPKKRNNNFAANDSSPKRRKRDDLDSDDANRTEGDDEQTLARSDDQIEEGRAQMNYHTMKKAIFMPEDKARSVISSYIVAGMRKGESDLQLECSLCQFRHDSEIEVYEHVALEHLMIYQYRCDMCSLKVKIKRHLVEHLLEQHGVDQVEGGEVRETTELVLTQEENGQVSVLVQDVQQEVQVEQVQVPLQVEQVVTTEQEGESSITLHLPVTNVTEPETIGDDFPYSEHNMRLVEGPGGSKKVFVGSAPHPLLRHNRSVLAKLSKGKLLTKEQADEMVFGYTIHNAGSGMYECTLCNGSVQKHKSYLIQRHLYDHFNIYFHRCELCHDIFRFPTQFKEHKEAHRKLMERQEEELEKQRTSKEQELLGNFHIAKEFTFLPPHEARPYVQSYYHLQDAHVYKCKLCSYTVDVQGRMYNHCVKHHMKLNQYQCDVCGEEVQTDIDIKRHYQRAHGQKIEINSKLDALARADGNYESHETEFPGIDDLSSLPMEALQGRKISTRQVKSIKGKHMIHNEETKLHECALCDYAREWRGNVQFHVLAQHYQVHQRSHKRQGDSESSPAPSEEEAKSETGVEWHLLQQPVFLGEEKGMQVARLYHTPDPEAGVNRCNMCDFSAKPQQASMHVLAKHLPMVHMFRCEFCARDFRYSRVRFKEHVAQHTEGKLQCPSCPDTSQEYTRESLKAHTKRVHSLGRYPCAVAECQQIFATKAEARAHEREVHLLGLPAKCVSHVCEWCDYAFPTRTRWKKHVVLCQRGTSRTGFRKQISDVLQWLGKGAYKCTFCSAEFHPEPDNVTRTGLPEARNHVASVHGMKHMRKAKMQWHGDPKHVNKEEIYKDKSYFWNQKVKDIEKVRSLAAQETKLFSIQNEVNENIAEAAKSHEEMLSTLGYQVLEPGQIEAQEQGEEGGRQVVISVINSAGEVEQRQVVVAGEGEVEQQVVWEEGEVEDTTVILGLGEQVEGVGGVEEEGLQYVEVVAREEGQT